MHCDTNVPLNWHRFASAASPFLCTAASPACAAIPHMIAATAPSADPTRSLFEAATHTPRTHHHSHDTRVHNDQTQAAARG